MTDGAGRLSPDASDTELVAAARDGDPVALEQLLRRHHDRILVLCRRLCRDRGDADDAAQNAMIAIVRGLDRFDGNAAFSTWSYRVTTNACLDELRRRGRRPVPEELDDETHRPVRTVPGELEQDPADAAVAHEESGRLQRALEQLPEDFRRPVVLRDLADMDYLQIGEILGLAPGTVRSRIARGRSKLLRILGDQEPEGNFGAPADVGTHDEP